jgi:hypothetical protein
MAQPDFFWGYLPFWAVNYGLALAGWACVGRWMLSFIVPGLQPNNYIWRSFVWLTEWAVRTARLITPASLGPRWMPLVASFWIFWLRIAAYAAMAAAGLTPHVGKA